MKKINNLFVCKFNRFRSKIAEAYFNKINKNKNHKAKSAGLIRGRYPLDVNQVAIAKKLGINLKGKPQGLTTDLLIWADIFIIVANDVPKNIFEYKKYNKKMIVWKIKDADSKNNTGIRKTINEIKNKIEKIVKKLK